jgi:hypothetical protein
MTRVVAFPLSGPKVPSWSNPGRPAIAGARAPVASPERQRGPARRIIRWVQQFSSELSRNIFRPLINHIVRNVVLNVAVARNMAAAQLRPASVPVLAAVAARAHGTTVIGGWYLADRTFRT